MKYSVNHALIVLALAWGGCGAPSPDDHPPTFTSSTSAQEGEPEEDAGAPDEEASRQENEINRPDCSGSAAGCPCGDNDRPLPCDVETDRTEPPDVPCWLGQRVCREGLWSRCEPYRPQFR